MASKEVKDCLNKLVATEGVLYIRLHQFHWYVKGHGFFVLHEKFEELYDESTEFLDEVAERLLSIGGQPYSTLKEFIEHSVIKEETEDKVLKQDEMVRAVIDDFNKIRDFLVEAIHLTDEHEDFPSNDLLIGRKEAIDKHLWMLEAYLGNEANA